MLPIHKTVPCTPQYGACPPGGTQGSGVCSLWARSSQFSRQFRKDSDVCPASPLREQSFLLETKDGWKGFSKVWGRNSMKGKGKHCHSRGLCTHRYGCGCVGGSVCVFPPCPSLPSHFLQNRQELERDKRMELVFLPLPFLYYKFLSRPMRERVNCFFKFYQQERTQKSYSSVLKDCVHV